MKMQTCATLCAAALGLLATTVASPARAENRLLNPSAEAADPDDPGKPAGWLAQVWGGVKASFEWSGDAYEGGRALYVRVDQTAAEGDARWLSDPVTVTASEQLRVSARYRANVGAHLLVRFTAVGKVQKWALVEASGPTVGWALARGDVTVPEGYTAMQVAFVLKAPGNLTTDTYAVGTPPSPPAPADGEGNALANGSFEQIEDGKPGKPVAWSFEALGKLSATGSLQTSGGADGANFARIRVVSSAPESDAKWWSDPVAIRKDVGEWMIGLRWRADARARLMLRLGLAAGTKSWRLVRRLEPAGSWKQAEVPTLLGPEVETVRVAVVLSDKGRVDMDDVRLHALDWGGDPGGKLRVSVSVDAPDGRLDGALQALAASQATGTVFLPSALLGEAGAVAIDKLLAAEKNGIEVGALGDDPAHWGGGAPQGYRGGVLRAYAGFESHGLHAVGMAPPDGTIDEGATDLVDGAGGYVRLRAPGYNFPPYDKLALSVRSVTSAIGPEQVAKWADGVRRHGGWLVLRYVGVGAGGAVSAARLAADIGALKAAGAELRPIGKVLGLWSRPKPADGQGNALVNGSFEDEGPVPRIARGWRFETLGNATAKGNLEQGDATDGTRFVRIEVGEVGKDADAKIISDAVELDLGVRDWLLSASWRGDARARLMVRERLLNGDRRWRAVAWLEPAEQWQQGRFGLHLDDQVQSVQVAFVVGTTGRLDVDDAALHESGWGGDPQGKLRVSFAVDQVHGDVGVALLAFEQAAVRGTVFVPSKTLGSIGSTSLEKLRRAERDGQEIGALADDPATWGPTSAGGYRLAVIRAFGGFEQAGLHVHGFAPPDGRIDGAAIEAVDSHEGYLRTLVSGVNYRPYSYLGVRVRDVTPETTPAELVKWAQTARRYQGWLVLRYAGVGEGGAVGAERLADDIAAIKGLGSTIAPVGEVVGIWSRPGAPPTRGGLYEESGGWLPGCGAGGGRRGAPFGLLWLLLAAAGAVAVRRFRWAAGGGPPTGPRLLRACSHPWAACRSRGRRSSPSRSSGRCRQRPKR